jgi:3-hydroxyacyl-CoA dehydrogenase
MKLLELVEGKDTDPAVTETMATFGEEVLGKGIVYGKDTTNFIANRIGVYGIMLIMHEMHDYDMTVEGVDVLFGKPLARPKSAVFRTADLVGLDTLVHVANNCHETLEDDEERGVFEVPDFVGEMVDNEWLGSKTGKGFYEKTSEGIQALRLDSMEYEPRDKPKFESTDVKGNPPAERVRLVLHEGEDRAADFARLVTLRTLAYSARRLGEIADDIVNIDRAMRWGFSWDLGPFETWDAVGLEWGVEKMDELDIDVPDWVREMVDAEGVDAFYTWDGATKKYYDPDSGEYREVPFDDRELAQLEFTERREDTEIMGNSSATLWDMGDGVACLQFHTKMNAIDPDIIEMMHDSIAYVEDHDWNGLVVGNDAENFSAGANLLLVVGNAMQEQWEPIEEMVTRFQQANQRLRYSRKPVVTAPAGRTLGGGAEVAMSGNIVQAAGESYVGLVEVGVGLIPGGGGNLQLMRNVMGRHSDSKDVEQQAFLKQIFMTIGTAQYSMSAEEAREMGFLTEADHVSMNRSYQLHDAKQAVLGLANSGFIPPRPSKFRLPGEAGAATIDMMLYSMVQNGQISEYDRHIGRKLAHVMCGGSTSPTVLVTEERLLELEREVFLSLCGEEKSQARMKHMLQEGKPLRN